MCVCVSICQIIIVLIYDIIVFCKLQDNKYLNEQTGYKSKFAGTKNYVSFMNRIASRTTFMTKHF